MNQFLVPLLLTLIHLTPFSTSPGLRQTHEADNPGLIVVRGRIVCLDSRGRGDVVGCTEASGNFGLVRPDGRLYRFLSTDISTAMFTDPRVRQRELQITAKPLSGDKLEIVTVQSIRDGKLYDIYYFCELCNVRAYAPGPCPCCRAELEFRETPP
ncbi:MAG TPA: hypothetical protein VFB82_07815 [Blastocatellia bacterium]|nr:hypothetical protein [Blastocatellia bacterium]